MLFQNPNQNLQLFFFFSVFFLCALEISNNIIQQKLLLLLFLLFLKAFCFSMASNTMLHLDLSQVSAMAVSDVCFEAGVRCPLYHEANRNVGVQPWKGTEAAVFHVILYSSLCFTGFRRKKKQ